MKVTASYGYTSIVWVFLKKVFLGGNIYALPAKAKGEKGKQKISNNFINKEKKLTIYQEHGTNYKRIGSKCFRGNK